jgi:hypothetical protein
MGPHHRDPLGRRARDPLVTTEGDIRVPTVLLGNESVTEPYKPDEGTDETLIRQGARTSAGASPP